jgi:hypothetical protein
LARTDLDPTSNPEPAELAARVGRLLREVDPMLEPLPGGLSVRRFFRAHRDGGSRAIVMWLPEDSPERVFARDARRQLAFLEVQALLATAGVRVPSVLAYAQNFEILIVEDLGETLAERLVREPQSRDELYRTAVVELARAQQMLADLPADSVVGTRRFDAELLGWELDHFAEWGVFALGSRWSEAETEAFARAKLRLVEQITQLDYGFCHRDYQSRNLMALTDGTIAWIDFQDALLGPRAYDLVALLGDSYQSFEGTFVERQLAAYAGAFEEGVAQARLRFEFDLITVQRKLKDAGRFVFFDRRRGDPSYLRYYSPSLELARGALARLSTIPELLALEELVMRQIERAATLAMLAP